MAFTSTFIPLRNAHGSPARCTRRAAHASQSSRIVRMATPPTTVPTPMHDRVFVRIEEPPASTAGGLVLPSTATEKKEKIGVVVGVGRGRYSPYGVLEPMNVSVGDRVLWKNDFGAEKIEIEGTECLALRIPSIVAKW